MEPPAYNAVNFGVVHPYQVVEAAPNRLSGTQFTITLCSQVSVTLSPTISIVFYPCFIRLFYESKS